MDFEQESSKRELLDASLRSAAQSGTGKPPPTAYLERLQFVANHKLSISDFRQCLIRSVREEQIVMKAHVKKRQFLRVHVSVKVR